MFGLILNRFFVARAPSPAAREFSWFGICVHLLAFAGNQRNPFRLPGEDGAHRALPSAKSADEFSRSARQQPKRREARRGEGARESHKSPRMENHGRVGSPSGPKIQARMRRCGKKHSLTKSRGTRRNLPQGRSGAEKVEGGKWPRMIGGLTSVSAQVSGANAPSLLRAPGGTTPYR